MWRLAAILDTPLHWLARVLFYFIFLPRCYYDADPIFADEEGQLAAKGNHTQ